MDRHTKEGRREEGRGKKMRLEKHWGYPFKVRLFSTFFIKSKQSIVFKRRQRSAIAKTTLEEEKGKRPKVPRGLWLCSL